MNGNEWEKENPHSYKICVSKEERDTRKAICESCDSLNSLKTCRECHCFMPFKTWLKLSACPKNKW